MIARQFLNKLTNKIVVQITVSQALNINPVQPRSSSSLLAACAAISTISLASGQSLLATQYQVHTQHQEQPLRLHPRQRVRAPHLPDFRYINTIRGAKALSSPFSSCQLLRGQLLHLLSRTFTTSGITSRYCSSNRSLTRARSASIVTVRPHKSSPSHTQQNPSAHQSTKTWERSSKIQLQDISD